ncbi:hypothetical protein LPB140_11750 [Sphingorhabdus lutea]|uniref:Uncharacterized protein n=1 Tax=Sphingorhabdus lutea TaxID=1913578 RepID=A0A1L3JDZ5_9SPHN|nr:hypothetical protein [Sphingorhabdus lutea]APG63350.1 hypothetical protein LPB140_11750 [Sphingorhabdus lutea]
MTKIRQYKSILALGLSAIMIIGSPPLFAQDLGNIGPRNLTELRFDECMDLALEDPERAVAEASIWYVDGGKFYARHCLGFAHAQAFRFNEALIAFVDAAQQAEKAKDKIAARFWMQAGNAALADNQFTQAITHIDAGLALGTLTSQQQGEGHLDKARALVMLENPDAAKAELQMAQKLAAEDPLIWLLSATLARRMGDLPLAKADIITASKLSPNDPAIALEAGNIAFSVHDFGEAKTQWQQAITLRPNGRHAETAKGYLDQLNDVQAPEAASTDASASAEAAPSSEASSAEAATP